MTSWDELFADEKCCELIPETAVYRFCSMVEGAFEERPLRFWNLGCGVGRHTVTLARLGHDVYAIDDAQRAVDLAKQRLADMTECTPQPRYFHGVVSWDVLRHNRNAVIRAAVTHIYNALMPGGF